jgi:hypothetical protein
MRSHTDAGIDGHKESAWPALLHQGCSMKRIDVVRWAFAFLAISPSVAWGQADDERTQSGEVIVINPSPKTESLGTIIRNFFEHAIFPTTVQPSSPSVPPNPAQPKPDPDRPTEAQCRAAESKCQSAAVNLENQCLATLLVGNVLRVNSGHACFSLPKEIMGRSSYPRPGHRPGGPQISDWGPYGVPLGPVQHLGQGWDEDTGRYSTPVACDLGNLVSPEDWDNSSVRNKFCTGSFRGRALLECMDGVKEMTTSVTFEGGWKIDTSMFGSFSVGGSKTITVTSQPGQGMDSYCGMVGQKNLAECAASTSACMAKVTNPAIPKVTPRLVEEATIAPPGRTDAVLVGEAERFIMQIDKKLMQISDQERPGRLRPLQKAQNEHHILYIARLNFIVNLQKFVKQERLENGLPTFHRIFSKAQRDMKQIFTKLHNFEAAILVPWPFPDEETNRRRAENDLYEYAMNEIGAGHTRLDIAISMADPTISNVFPDTKIPSRKFPAFKKNVWPGIIAFHHIQPYSVSK